jgi:hypothetical protein
MKIFTLIMFLMFATVASAGMKSFFVKSTKNSSGHTLCHYDNGSVINIGLKIICPMSINT